MSAPATDWHARAAALRPRTDAFVDGRWTAALSGETFDDIDPATGRVFAHVAACDAPDVERAVAAARAAFESGSWSAQPPAQRKQVLLRFAELILAHREELALLETLDVGKPIADSLDVDVASTARCIRWYAEAVDKLYDEVAPTGPAALATITREPVGVVGAIVPWNFPLIMAAWKIGPARGRQFAGAQALGEVAAQCTAHCRARGRGGPAAGRIQRRAGFGHTAGKALALSMGVDCIAFTGSTATGKLIMQYAAQSNLKRVGLECGGKSPNIIMADCPDLERAAAAAAAAIFFNQGEMCSAGSRLLVDERIKDELLEKVLHAARAFEPGDPLDPRTRLGAIVDETQLRRVLGYIEAGRADGARLATGGRRVREQSGGYFVEPTVFDAVTPRMRIAGEEIFGPVLATLSFRGPEQALAIANDVIYGLAAAVWTRDVTTAHRMARGLRAGMVYVNCYDADDITVPFGGFKQSGIGRDKSLHAFDKYTELKTTWIDLS
ncbi:MAG: aldehyde dehydrogenase [Steroidobacteraceae bacterium]